MRLLSSLFGAVLAVVLPLTQALRFSHPTSADFATSTNFTVAKGDHMTVTWQYDTGEPGTFSLFLWEFKNFPPTYFMVKPDVDSTTKTATFQVPCRIDSSPNWQLTMINGTNVYVLYAQTARFSIVESSGPCVYTQCQPQICSSTSSVGGWEFATGLFKWIEDFPDTIMTREFKIIPSEKQGPRIVGKD